MKKFYLVLIPLFALALLVGCAPEKGTPTPPPPVKQNQPIGFDGTYLSGKHTVILKTSKGDVTIELDGDAAPKTVTNFVALSKAGYYNGLTFHRVIPDFMIQGGDPNGNGTGGGSIYGSKFEDEIKGNNLPMDRGMIAMANAGPDTNGSQFFIITKEGGTPWLIGKHTVFGKVTKGMDIVDAISKVNTGANDMPADPVTFEVEVVN